MSRESKVVECESKKNVLSSLMCCFERERKKNESNSVFRLISSREWIVLRDVDDGVGMSWLDYIWKM
ncbi:MAG: hypothetical protein COB29_01175 [Sulfitobacter sp.]|nr:MAG: hypothetical protein COB29_01175 [Sulfitobacter sp.]